MVFFLQGATIFLATCLGVGLFRRLAVRAGILDRPNSRSSHQTAVPRGGGVVIVLVTLVSVNLHSFLTSGTFMGAFTVGGGLVAAVSLMDDVVSVKHYARLAVHSLAAALFVYVSGGFSVVEIPLVGAVELGWTGRALSFLWIVWLINAYNFMDGIDGIAALQAVVAGFGLFAVGTVLGDSRAEFSGLVLGLSSLGFLVHNWSPAKIFMGDVGSAFLGFSFSTLPMLLADGADGSDSRVPLVALSLVWLFVVDAALTLIRRAGKLEPLWEAHRTHIYQRLVAAGWSHGAVALFYGAVSAIVSACLVAALAKEGEFQPIMGAVLVGSTCLLLGSLALRERIAATGLGVLSRNRKGDSA